MKWETPELVDLTHNNIAKGACSTGYDHNVETFQSCGNGTGENLCYSGNSPYYSRAECSGGSNPYF